MTKRPTILGDRFVRPSRNEVAAHITAANVDIDPVIVIRLRSFREHDLAGDAWNQSSALDGISSAIAKKIYALPLFAPSGAADAYADCVVGPEADVEERKAAALLYVVLMTDLSLDRVSCVNPIIIEGSRARSELFARLLRVFRPQQSVFARENVERSAFGGDFPSFDQHYAKPLPNERLAATTFSIAGLAEYRRHWRALVEPVPQKAGGTKSVREKPAYENTSSGLTYMFAEAVLDSA